MNIEHPHERKDLRGKEPFTLKMYIFIMLFIGCLLIKRTFANKLNRYKRKNE